MNIDTECLWPHPRVTLGKDADSLRLLTSREVKEEMLHGLGVDRLHTIEFSREFASLSALDYIRMLRDGSGWRMPNVDEFKVLLDSSLFEMIYGYADGRWGFLLRRLKEGYTGKFIFLPRTGYYNAGSLTGTNTGYYWSRNIDQQSWTSSSFANTLQLKYVYAITAEWSRMDRANGLPIRPVYIQ